MTQELRTDQVWEAIENELFCVLGMVNKRNQARTVGVAYIVRDRVLYIGTGINTWKARHIMNNPHVSVTIPIPKRILFLPWIKVPQATITFSGTATVTDVLEVKKGLLQAVFRHKADDKAFLQETCIIEIAPQGDFITYGVGIPLIKIRQPEQARGRASVR
jgi:hypothetical protein